MTTPAELTEEEARVLRGVAASPNTCLLLTDMQELCGGLDPRWHGIAPTLVKRRLLNKSAVLGAFPCWFLTKNGAAALRALDARKDVKS